MKFRFGPVVALIAVGSLLVSMGALSGCGGSSSPAAPAAATASLSVASISFTNLAGSSAAAQTATLTNNGGTALTVSGITITGTNASSFSQTNTCGATVAASASCTITVNFTATTAGNYSATLVIANSASTGGSVSIPLSGTVTAPTPVASLNATTLTFPSMLTTATATAQTVTLTNSGTGSLTISGITISGTNASNFSQTNTCGTALAVGGSCKLTVSFAATSAGSYSATLAIANNSSTPSATVALSGTTTAPPGPTATLDQTTLTFPSMVAGATATAQTVKLTNNGGTALTISGITISGTNASNFSESTTCSATLAISASCTTTVNFAATTAGSFSASLNIANNSSTSPVTVALSGTAVVPTISLSTTSLTFPLMVAGATSTAQSVTLTNNGTGPVTLGAISIGGTNASAFSKTTTCGTTLAVAGTCTVTLSYAETTTASDVATLSIINNTATTPVTVALAGSAAVPTMTANPTSLVFPLTAVGSTSASQSVTLTNTGTVPVIISALSFTGTNASAFSETTTCGTTLAVASTCTVTASFTPTTGGTYSATLTILNNTSTGSTTVAVSSTASVAAVISPSSTALTFSTPAESTSATQTVTVKNTGTAALVITTDKLAVSSASSFNVTADTCAGATVAAGSTCTITVSLTAFLATSYTGSITIASNAVSGANVISLTGTGTGTITLTGGTTSSTNWIIDNGALTLHFDPAQFHIWGAYLDGDSNNLVDTTSVNSKDGKPNGFYMGNQGLGYTTVYTGSQTGPGYLDVWAGEASGTANAFTYEMHIVVTANDPGYHTYYVLNHSATDIAGSVSLVLWQFRTNLNLFTHSYTVDSGLNNLGPMDITLPSVADSGSTDAARQAQNAVVELSGFTDAPTTTFMAQTNRNFYTKYDYSTYEYLHKGQGTYGPTYGAWVTLPRADTIAGGPTKQDVNTLTDLIQQEMVGAHYDGHGGAYNPDGLAYTLAANAVANKNYGPIYVHFNKMNGTNTVTGAAITTPAAMYQDAMSWMPWFDTLYDNDSTLVSGSPTILANQTAGTSTNIYVPSTARGTVSIAMSGIPTGLATHTAWAVLSDPNVNMQYSVKGYQYWADISANGTATITGIVPGTYRLTVYVLGYWGEYRYDGIVVTANNTTNATGTWVPENFGTTVFTLGTPDRSAHEFLHGEDSNGNDYRNYYGQFNYWADFANTAVPGAAIYYATATTTAGVTTPATNDLTKWNYIHWGGTGFNNTGSFNPGIDGNYWCNTTTDNTTDGYKCIIPSYVATLYGTTVTNNGTTYTSAYGVYDAAPAWQIHFATPANLSSYSSGYVELSVSVACAYGSYVITLNGSQQRTWHYDNYSDCMIRSGLSGYTQWFVMEWPTSLLTQTVGGDNVLSVGMSGTGSSDDAFRLELSNTGSNPVTTGWHDYTYTIGTNYPGSGTANSSGLYNDDTVDNP